MITLLLSLFRTSKNFQQPKEISCVSPTSFKLKRPNQNLQFIWTLVYSAGYHHRPFPHHLPVYHLCLCEGLCHLAKLFHSFVDSFILQIPFFLHYILTRSNLRIDSLTLNHIITVSS